MSGRDTLASVGLDPVNPLPASHRGEQWRMATKNPKETVSRLWRIFQVVVAIAILAAVLLAIAVFRNPEWHEHLVRIMSRAWRVFLAQDMGTTGRGILNYGLEGVISIIAVAAMTRYAVGWKEFEKEPITKVAIALFAFAAVALVLYGTQLAWEVAHVTYEDHKVLVTKLGSVSEGDAEAISGLKIDNKNLKLQLDTKSHELDVGDPAFQNLMAIERVFSVWRRAIGETAPCEVKITAPPASYALASSIGALANNASLCAVSGPQATGSNPDVDRDTFDGIDPEKVILHAPRDDQAANQMQNGLSNFIEIRRSYDVPAGHQPNFIWLQFGTNTKWYSKKFEELQGK